MCYSTFLAQIIGLFLFLVSLTMLLHQPRWKKITVEMLSHHALLAFTGVVGTVLGLILVVTHNVWVSSWPVLITLVGWVLLLQSLMRLFYPDAFIHMMKALLEKGKGALLNWICLLIGIYLIWVGFFKA